jgi:hypothetical protein
MIRFLKLISSLLLYIIIHKIIINISIKTLILSMIRLDFFKKNNHLI